MEDWLSGLSITDSQFLFHRFIPMDPYWNMYILGHSTVPLAAG